MTRCILLQDHRFGVSEAGKVESPTNYSEEFLASRYLVHFTQLRVLARFDGHSRNPSAISSSIPGVTIVGLGTWEGFRGLVRPAARLIRELWQTRGDPDIVVIAVVPGMLSLIGSLVCRAIRKPYAVEVVGDIEQALLMNGKYPTLARLAGWLTRDMVRHARGAAFVTEHALQRKYPPSASAHTGVYSSAILGASAFADEPSGAGGDPITIVTVATMRSPYKGIDILLKAVAAPELAGRLRLLVVGDGPYRKTLEDIAEKAGATDVTFVGHLAGPAEVQPVLDRADLVVHPSMTEGLPRVVLEAMARGKPCIATDVGGTSELLGPSALVVAGDVGAMTAAIGRVAADPIWRRDQASRNLTRARDFAATELDQRRKRFYQGISA